MVSSDKLSTPAANFPLEGGYSIEGCFFKYDRQLNTILCRAPNHLVEVSRTPYFIEAARAPRRISEIVSATLRLQQLRLLLKSKVSHYEVPLGGSKSSGESGSSLNHSEEPRA